MSNRVVVTGTVREVCLGELTQGTLFEFEGTSEAYMLCQFGKDPQLWAVKLATGDLCRPMSNARVKPITGGRRVELTTIER